MVRGRVKNIINGRRKALNRPSIRALKNNEAGLVISKPGRTWATTRKAIALTNNLNRKCFIFSPKIFVQHNGAAGQIIINIILAGFKPKTI